MNSFHRWLLKHRPYCELCSGPYPSTRIIQIDNRDRAVCDSHWRAYHPLQAGFEKRYQMMMDEKADVFELPEDLNLMVKKLGTSGEIDGGGKWCIRTINKKER